MIDFLKSVLFGQKIAGLSPYKFHGEQIKIEYFYTLIVFCSAFLTRGYVVWWRFFANRYFISNYTTTFASFVNSTAFDIYICLIFVFFCQNTVPRVKTAIYKILNLTKTELNFDEKDKRTIFTLSYIVYAITVLLFSTIHLLYYLENPIGEKNETVHILFAIFFWISGVVPNILTVQFPSFVIIVFVIFTKINELMEIRLQNILFQHFR